MSSGEVRKKHISCISKGWYSLLAEFFHTQRRSLEKSGDLVLAWAQKTDNFSDYGTAVIFNQNSPYQSNKGGLKCLSRNWSAIDTSHSCGLLFLAPKARPKIAQGKRPQGASPWVRVLSERSPVGAT